MSMRYRGGPEDGEVASGGWTGADVILVPCERGTARYVWSIETDDYHFVGMGYKPTKAERALLRANGLRDVE